MCREFENALEVKKMGERTSASSLSVWNVGCLTTVYQSEVVINILLLYSSCTVRDDQP